jgi:HAD superfamily hydrolase (TIGR01490 family)
VTEVETRLPAASPPRSGAVPEGTRGIALFDVDETLLAVKSMVSFYRYLCELPSGVLRSAPDGQGQAGDLPSLQALERLLAAGLPREQANVEYYRLLAGLPAARVADAGRAWFANEVCGDVVVRPVAQRLSRHLALSHTVVLVSGSFPACLDPVAEFFGVATVLCSRPDVVDDRYTGTLAEPMIGLGKARAAAAVITGAGPEVTSWAYGDHPSDLPLLRQVDHPVVVGADPVLRAHAREHGWDVVETQVSW